VPGSPNVGPSVPKIGEFDIDATIVVQRQPFAAQIRCEPRPRLPTFGSSVV
jgi:hypothetical protein